MNVPNKRTFSLYFLLSLLLIACSASTPIGPSTPPLPTSPANVQAIPGIGFITINWEDYNSDSTEFIIYRQTTDAEGNEQTSLREITRVNASQNAYNDNDVTAQTYYVYAVSTVNANGESDLSLQNNEPVTPNAQTTPQLELSPASASLEAGDSTYFEAVVTGAEGSVPDITWSATGGSVEPQGGARVLYVAPDTAGVYTLVAQSTTDSSLRAEATVTVTVNAPPVIDVFRVSPEAGTVPTDVVFSWSLRDPDGDALVCELAPFEEIRYEVDCNAGSFSYTYDDMTGEVQAALYVEDGHGHAASAFVTVTLAE